MTVLMPDEYDINFITETIAAYEIDDEVYLSIEKLKPLKKGELEIDYDHGYMIQVSVSTGETDSNLIKSTKLTRLKTKQFREMAEMLTRVADKLDEEDALLKLSNMGTNVADADK